MERFGNVLDASQALQAHRLLAHFDEAMRRDRIDYAIDGGTLIGSMLHHDRIPWDDDFDVYVRIEDKRRVLRALNNRQSGYVVTSNGLYSKLWNRNPPRVRNHRAWNWPFLDIGWLSHNETHMWEERSRDRRYGRNVYLRSWIFPSVRRPFGSLVLSAPRHADALLRYRFGPRWSSTCVVNHWNHILETWRYRDAASENTRASCEQVNVSLVRRISYSNGTSIEWIPGGGAPLTFVEGSLT